MPFSVFCDWLSLFFKVQFSCPAGCTTFFACLNISSWCYWACFSSSWLPVNWKLYERLDCSSFKHFWQECFIIGEVYFGLSHVVRHLKWQVIPLWAVLNLILCLRWQHSDLSIKVQFYHLLLERTLWNSILVPCK